MFRCPSHAFRVLICFLFLSPALCACGFQPLYGEAGKLSNPQSAPLQAFQDMQIGVIPDRSGQKLRNELIDRLHGPHHVTGGRYFLASSRINESRLDFDVTRESDATRTQLRLTVSIRLIDRETNKTVLTRDFEAFSSYNILDSQYTTRVSRDNARDSGILDLSRQIERALALYFKRREN